MKLSFDPPLLRLPGALIANFWKNLALYQDGRGLWLVGGLSALGLEFFSVLFFQIFLKLNPCEECVQVRFSMYIIFLGGLIGAIAPRRIFFKIPGYICSFFGVFLGLLHTLTLENINLEIQVNPDYLPLCSPEKVHFLFNLPLDSWFPRHFKPSGLCGEDSLWEFAGFTMTQQLIMIFIVYFVGLTFMAISFILSKQKKHQAS
ncbi:MAG: disulfide bond formation protein B [Deltaproteobacteria bacterium]|jgi:disulfide bond formation protein DsbB|nr:disulfide bond formation protein B [Deltaproteobacteria bacterium]